MRMGMGMEGGIALLMLLVAIVTACAAWCFRVFSLFNKLRTEMHASHEELHDFKLFVAQKYIQQQHLQGMETKFLASEARMLDGLNQLTIRIDRLLDKYSDRKPT